VLPMGVAPEAVSKHVRLLTVLFSLLSLLLFRSLSFNTVNVWFLMLNNGGGPMTLPRMLLLLWMVRLSLLLLTFKYVNFGCSDFVRLFIALQVVAGRLKNGPIRLLGLCPTCRKLCPPRRRICTSSSRSWFAFVRLQERASKWSCLKGSASARWRIS